MTEAINREFSEPILIVAFNRPDRVEALIEVLRDIRPTQVFLAVDGPRPGHGSDGDLVGRTRKAAELIDWPCQVQTRFLTENLGCGRAVSSAINWFFSIVDRGIILEDDVLPSPEFFDFCAELLERYRDDSRVFAISGCNFVPTGIPTQDASYRFSALTHVWGWATWRRAWEHYRFDMRDWRSRLPLGRRWKAMGGDIGGFAYWTAVFDWMRWGRIDTWDYQWTLAQMASGGLTATSNANLVDNVGFREDATHTVVKPSFVREVEMLRLPLVHPAVERDLVADRWIRSRVLQVSTSSGWRMVRDNLLQRAAGFKNRKRGIE